MYRELHAIQFRSVLHIVPHRQVIRRGPQRTRGAVKRSGDEAGVMRRIDRFLRKLRERGRRSVSIVDTACGDGHVLISAARRARSLGFVAIEARGFDRSRRRIDEARAVALSWRDPAAGFSFFVHEDATPLPVDDGEADLTITVPGADSDSELARVTGFQGFVLRHAGNANIPS